MARLWDHPLGPPIERAARPGRWATRLRSAVVLALGVLLIGLAARLEPSPAGLGTHTQLGLGACALPMITGWPCPTCGMTTAFAHTARGRWLTAMYVQPAGFLMALGVIAASVLSLVTLISGRGWRINWFRVSPALLIWTALSIVVGGWLFKLGSRLFTG